MNPLDLVAVLLVIVGLILGARSGAIPQIGGLAGAIAGGAGAVLLLRVAADALAEVDPTMRPWFVLGGLVVAVGLGESVGAGAGRRLLAALSVASAAAAKSSTLMPPPSCSTSCGPRNPRARASANVPRSRGWTR